MTPPTAQLLRSRIGKVCVAIQAATVDEMLDKAATAVKDVPFLEFRLDYLTTPADAVPAIKDFLAVNTAAIAIATCRRKENGGHFQGTLDVELEILTLAAAGGVQIVDLEVESAEALRSAALQRLRDTGAALLISHHDFTATPDLDGICRRILAFQPDFMKVVSTAQTLTDNITLLHFIKQASDHASVIGTVGICMGDAGVVSRVLGLRAGAAFTFASAIAGEETGPGQIDARTLLDLYRVDQIDAATKIFGVAGNPVRSSLSPLMLNTAFRRETVNAAYLPLQADTLPDLLKLVHTIPLQGLSVTMPFKQEILPHLEKTDPLTTKIGACNTVLRAPDGKLYGFNTDVAGIVGPLEKRMPLRGAKVLVLGAGGAARAAVFGLKDRGAEVFIFNRTPETAQKLAKQAGAKTFKRESLAKTTFDILVNATPVGMAGQNATPLLDAKELNAKLVFDLVYNPLETPLLRQARQQGIPIVTGVEMFVQQGARQFEIWTGKPAPQEEMLRVVLHALKQRAEAAIPELATS